MTCLLHSLCALRPALNNLLEYSADDQAEIGRSLWMVTAGALKAAVLSSSASATLLALRAAAQQWEGLCRATICKAQARL